ncbi:porphobilinogen synthase [Devosia sp. CN2-171]|uniref:porphobilinogen synthase n=1 Tax=Devosia sp. CN2-171 TaxID=3400909 RepID=UPI003BF80925
MSSNWPRHDMSFLGGRRQRRLRRTDWMRNMVRETVLTPHDFILPIFVEAGTNTRSQIRTMPGVERVSVDLAVEVARAAAAEGIPALAIFPNTEDGRRNESGTEAFNPDNLTARALRAIKDKVPGIGLITDVALDEYSSDGQDGLVRDGEILNDETVEVMVKAALMQARAGADIIAPSDMMDGRVAAIRAALDDEGFEQVAMMSYSAKFASAFYGPFREAVGSGSRLKGDKRTYQLDFANTDEAMREVEQDIAEGADMVMVKPGMPYLDIVRRVRDEFDVPVFAYQVSGEYAMLKLAGQAGAINGEAAMMESLIAFKRAGCDGVLTYFALEAARKLNG